MVAICMLKFFRTGGLLRYDTLLQSLFLGKYTTAEKLNFVVSMIFYELAVGCILLNNVLLIYEINVMFQEVICLPLER